MDGLGLQPAPPSRSPLSARAFGAEVLLGELIGRGGMSRVYRGWLRADGLEVAVKVLRDDLADAPDAVQRFVRERDLLAAVAGPHVVRVHDLVVHENEIGIVMDLVAGGHLRRAVTFPCPPAQAAELTAQIADGLAAVHATGVVHRDLKPENVLVDRDEAGSARLRLTDFGISRLVDAGTLTQTTVTGTPGYLAPEVAGGGKVTAAADIYALGVILYELCTGRGPFLADNALVLILTATRQEAPRPGGMPDPLWSLLAAMLAKDPARRPGAAETARTLRALAPALSGVPVCTPPTPSADVGAAELAVAAPVARAHLAPPAGTPLTTSFAPPSPPRSRREGRRTGFVGPDRQVGDGEGRRHPRTLAAMAAAAGALVVVAVAGGGWLIGREPGTINFGPAPSSAGPSVIGQSTTGPSTPASTRPDPTDPIRPVSPYLTTVPPPSPIGSGGTPPGRSSPVPGVPSLARTVGTPQELHSSDQQARLTIGNVSPGAGTIVSITISYGTGTKLVPVGGGKATSYLTVVDGLTNGRPYTFTATVCNSTKLCSSSAPFTFTPFGAPEVQPPVLSVNGLVVSVRVAQVLRNSHPGRTTCTLSVAPADPGTPQEKSVDPEGDSLTFTGKASAGYTATETCSTDDVPDGSVPSNTVTTGAAPPTAPPSPSSSQSPAAAAGLA
jgi:serine/threonine-protein kinase